GDALAVDYGWAPQGETETRPVSVIVRIAWTSCHFGGRRPWFRCPECDRRVTYLIPGAGRVACRLCFRLTYGSQTEGRGDRGFRKARRIRRRLGGDGNLARPFPGKPPRMQ